MEAVKIEGKTLLKGVVTIDGSKNSAVALVPATLLAQDRVILTNVPTIDDIDALIDILNYLNVEVEYQKEEKRLIIDSKKMVLKDLEKEHVSKLRASYYFMGTLLALYDNVRVASPGGCKIGNRPIDYHLEGFKKLGINVEENELFEFFKTPQHKGEKIVLPFPSVGATINLMLLASRTSGITIIENCAMEPEIKDVADLINKMGGKVTGALTKRIKIEGVEKMHSTTHHIIPDRIEAGTYLIIGAAIAEQIEVRGVCPNHLSSLLSTLTSMNVPLLIKEDRIIIKQSDNLLPVSITTGPYPGFPTDLQQPLTTLLTQAKGKSTIKETIYPDRTAHIHELNKMGLECRSVNNIILVQPGSLKGARISAKDLRGGASLVIAGLLAQGQTILTGINFIKRGYGNFIKKLNQLGAKIELIEVEDDRL